VIADERELCEAPWDLFPFPAFVKPAHEGSSMGIRFNSRVEDVGRLVEVATPLLARYQQPVLVEEFIHGDEVTVGVVGNSPPRVVGIMRVVPRRRERYFIYSLEVKRDWRRLVDYECPARLEADIVHEIAESGLRAFEAVGCRDVARIDFRISHDGVPYFLEINPLPGLNPASGDLPIMASRMGVSYETLIGDILHSALERYSQCVRQSS
jgi:D-alanine-D-alanine ligase